MLNVNKNDVKKNWLSLGIIVALLVICIDQITKFLSSEYLGFATHQTIFPGFDLTLRYNTGAAFSFLANASGWQHWFFIGLALIVSACIMFWLKTLDSSEKWEGLGLALILGGALGNLIDRLLYGHVIDFILLYYKQWEWPAFNIADSAITMGVIFFIFSLFKKPKTNDSNKLM